MDTARMPCKRFLNIQHVVLNETGGKIQEPARFYMS